jgi:hypothetical protein
LPRFKKKRDGLPRKVFSVGLFSLMFWWEKKKSTFVLVEERRKIPLFVFW